MSTIAADPAEVIHAAVTDLFVALRALVDRGPTDDPALLDELAALTRRARGRITRANKRAQQTAEKAAAASNTQAKQNAPGQAEPRKASLQPADTKPSEQPAKKTAPAAAKPAAQPVTMSLVRRPATRPAGTATPRRVSDAHPLTRTPRLHLLAAVLLVAGTALHITGVPGLVPVLLIGAAATSAVIQSWIRRARRRARSQVTAEGHLRRARVLTD